ncbi:MAG: pitrilysin family protein [Candidatus Falkowbacteria bacterium]
MSVSSTKINSGLQFLTVPQPGAKTVTALVLVGTGSKYESASQSGVSHFLEHLFFKGTKKYPSPMALSVALDAVGGEYNAFTSKEYTGYYMKVPAEKADLALTLVSEMLLASKFELNEVEKEKGVIVEEINMYEDNPMMYVEDVFESCLYGDTPAGRDTAGSKDTVNALTRQQIVDYFNAQYLPGNTVVCLTGKVSPALAKQAQKRFAEYARKNGQQQFQEKAVVLVNQSKPAVIVKFKQTDQAHILLGVHGLPYGHADEMAAKLLAVILGGSMSSRLFHEIREKRGLAYYVRTNAESYTDSGYIATQAGIRVNALPETIEVILVEYAKMAKTLVPATELRRVKDMIKGRVTLQLEASDDLGEWYSRQAVMLLTQARTGTSGRGKLYSPEEFFKRLEAVTVVQIRNIAKKIFTTEKLNLAVIGPYKNSAEIEAKLHF